MSLLKSDLKRYPHQKDMPIFQKFMRKYQDSNNKILKVLYKILFVFFRYSNKVEIAANSNQILEKVYTLAMRIVLQSIRMLLLVQIVVFIKV